MTNQLKSDAHLAGREHSENASEQRASVEAYHGGVDAQELQRYGISSDQVIDFSSNILPHGPSPKVRAAIVDCEIASYPDRHCAGLRDVIADHLGRDAAHILVGNGSSELIHLIARSMLQPGDNALIIGPTFSEYERASRLASARLLHYRADAANHFAVIPEEIDSLLQSHRVSMVWVCNPNNPTGQTIERPVLLDWIRTNRETVFVVDESYIEFSSRENRLSLAQVEEPNLIVLRSMTKSFGMAGVRLGYAILSESHHHWLCSQRIPWSVGSIAQAAGIAALRDESYYHRAIGETLVARAQLVSDLADLGLTSVPTETNYFLLRLSEASTIRHSLLKQGILVRDCASFGLPDYVRIAARDSQDNLRLVQAIAHLLGHAREKYATSENWRAHPVVVSPSAEASPVLQPNDVQEDNTWDVDFRFKLERLFRMRRDVRRFRTDPIPTDALTRWIHAACLAPSVGLSQPWRFVSVSDTTRRLGVVQEFETQNLLAAETYDEAMSSQYRRLKLAGLKEAPEHLAVFVDPDPVRGRGLGRQTMPESVVYSVVAAIQNLWLAARCEGVGVGWVSILRPEAINEVLDVSPQWRLVAYLCIGYPMDQNLETPELESLGWEKRDSLEQLWYQR